jgi:hypothetical protein
MAKTPTNNGKAWTKKDVQNLKTLVRGNTPTGLIAHELQRTINSVRSKASQLNVSLKPTNQSPYNRQKKHR